MDGTKDKDGEYGGFIPPAPGRTDQHGSSVGAVIECDQLGST